VALRQVQAQFYGGGGIVDPLTAKSKAEARLKRKRQSKPTLQYPLPPEIANRKFDLNQTKFLARYAGMIRGPD